MRLTIIDKTPSGLKVVLDGLDIFGVLGLHGQDPKAVTDRQKSLPTLHHIVYRH